MILFVSMKLWVAEFETFVCFVFPRRRHAMASFSGVKTQAVLISASRKAGKVIIVLLL